MRVALLGCGRWGTKLLRALCRHERFSVVAVADPAAAARARVEAIAPAAHSCDSVSAALRLEPDAVLVATPSECHVDHALAALAAGADVWVEKPLCLRAGDAERLCDRARELGRVGFTGHVLRYHPAIERLAALVRDGRVGAVRRLWGRRATQSGSASPLWTLAPHDLATLHAIDPSPVVEVAAHDLATAEATETHILVVLASGLTARFELCTTAATPQRRLSVCGERERLLIDELEGAGSLMSAPAACHDEWPPRAEVDLVELDRAEPLMVELSHFAYCVATRVTPRTGFEEGRWVVEVIERAEAALRARAPGALTTAPRREASA